MNKKLTTPKGAGVISFHIEYKTTPVPDEESYESSIATIIEDWGIDRELRMRREACNFYLLSDLVIDHPEVKPKLEEKASYLANQFSRALDMIIGGELRHAENHSDYEGSLPVNPGGSRELVWEEWKGLRESRGLEILEEALRIFRDYNWDGGYGGETWATATAVLLDYLKGEMSDIMFVDTAFGLQHNNNYIFDKLWNIDELTSVLDINRDGDMETLLYYADDEIHLLYKKYHDEREEQERI